MHPLPFLIDVVGPAPHPRVWSDKYSAVAERGERGGMAHYLIALRLLPSHL